MHIFKKKKKTLSNNYFNHSDDQNKKLISEADDTAAQETFVLKRTKLNVLMSAGWREDESPGAASLLHIQPFIAPTDPALLSGRNFNELSLSEACGGPCEGSHSSLCPNS